MSVSRPDQNPELSAKVDRFFAVRPVRGPSAGLAGSSTSRVEWKKAAVARGGASASASIGASTASKSIADVPTALTTTADTTSASVTATSATASSGSPSVPAPVTQVADAGASDAQRVTSF